MKRLVLAGLLLAAGPALAGSYADFSLGVTALTEERPNDTVIADFSRAIEAGDLAPGLLPTAYLDRGLAYMRADHCDLARADFDMSLKLRPDYLDSILGRGNAEACLGQYNEAAADFTTDAAARPTGWIYFGIGRMRWMAGDFTEANVNFQKSLQIDPNGSYALLWLGLSQMRTGTFDAHAFADYYSDMRVHDWPRPVLQFFLGRITAVQLAAEAAKGDAKDVPGQKCEGDFYRGEWQLTHGEVATGKASFQDAVNSCPKDIGELGPAQLELQRLQ